MPVFALRYNRLVLERVAEFITRYNMFRHGARAGIAVSGGADSVCLLHVLHELAPRWNLRLHVLHLNHCLRAAESDGDEQFVRDLAAQFGLPVRCAVWNRPERAENLEQSAREARLAFFQDAISSGEVETVALGHTRSDQAETVLFRFLRGAGTAGLAGIRPVTATGIVRPLLAVTRSETESYLRAHDIPWREDSTNRSPAFARNRLRHQLLPQLARDWNPAISDTLANTAEWALAEEAYWEAEIDRLAAALLHGSKPAITLRTKELLALPRAAARRLVRRAMELVKGDLRGIDFAHVEAALRMSEGRDGSGRFQAHGLDVYRSFDWLRIGLPGFDNLATRNFRVPATVPGTNPVPFADTVLELELIENVNGNEGLSDSVYNDVMGCVDWTRVSGPLDLRNWRPGDRYQPVGYSGEEKIKTLFQEARVPLWDRRHWPVLVDGESIVWARQFGPALPYAAHAGARKVLTIRETGAAAPTFPTIFRGR